MKKPLIAGTLALSLFCTSFCAGQPNEPVKEIPHAEARILLSTSKTQFHGEEVLLEVSLENTGTTPFLVSGEDFDHFYQIEVTAWGREIQTLPYFKSQQGIGFSRRLTIPPHGKKTGHIYLNRTFDLSVIDQYKVIVSTKITQADGIFTVTSQPLYFGITSPPSVGAWD